MRNTATTCEGRSTRDLGLYFSLNLQAYLRTLIKLCLSLSGLESPLDLIELLWSLLCSKPDRLDTPTRLPDPCKSVMRVSSFHGQYCVVLH